VVIEIDMNYVGFGFLTFVLRFEIRVFRDVSLFCGAQRLDPNPEDEGTMRF